MLLSVVVLSISCGGADEPFDLEQYEADNLQWRAERLARLRGPTGYLNLAGLFWLTDLAKLRG